MGYVKQETGRREVHHVPLSFEAGEQGAVKVYFPYKVRVTKVRSGVVKALAATDAGTITVATAAGTVGVLTHAASAAIGNEQNTGAVATSNLNLVPTDSYVQLTTAKATAGGKVIASVEIVVA